MLALIATLCAGLFSGAALYISIVQHPAANRVGDGFPARFFQPMYQRAAPVQASLALVGSACAAATWLGTGMLFWGLGAVLLFFSIPWTLIVIKPVNDKLLAPAADCDAEATDALLRRWATLHWVRTFSSLLAFTLCLLALPIT